MLIKRIISFSLIASFFFLLTGASFADEIDLKNKIFNTIKNEIVKKYRAYRDAKIEINLSALSNQKLDEINNDSAKNIIQAILPDDRRIPSSFAVPIRVSRGEKLEKEIILQAKIKVFMPVLASSIKIRKGEIFSEENICTIDKDVLILPDSVIFEKSKIFGKESITFVPSGVVLLDWMARDIPVIKKGDIIEVYKKLNDIEVRSQAESLEDGYKKTVIKVKNMVSKKILDAIVINSKEAEAQ